MRFSLTLLLVLGFQLLNSQPNREFRGVWIATVANIDWPSKSGLTKEEQQKEFISLLELHKNNGMNAVIVQIRPSADAFYESRYEPWSKWLTGKLGKAPNPYYDPLKFMIQAAHERGLEFHAWFNPYRVLVDLDKNGIDSASIAFRKPKLVVRYGSNLYFDPGLPEARNHTIHVIMEVVTRYDIDAVHFDDYFYPYKIQGQDFPDSLSFAAYGRGFSSKDDWRRNNVDLLIKQLSDTIHRAKPYVQFGISPFGVWRNQEKDPNGSATKAGQTCYDDLYADVLKWQKEKWIDYVLPQIYWPIGFEVADYDVIARWWNDNSFAIPVYVGHGAYRVGNHSDERWKDPAQIGRQIRLSRSLSNILGGAYFSSRSFTSNPLGLNDSLQQKYYSERVLPPYVRRSDQILDQVQEISFTFSQNRGVTLLWRDDNGKDLLNPHHRYVIYRTYKKQTKIVAIVPGHSDLNYQTYEDRTIHLRSKYQYGISVVDRFNQESKVNYSDIISFRKKSWRIFR